MKLTNLIHLIIFFNMAQANEVLYIRPMPYAPGKLEISMDQSEMEACSISATEYGWGFNRSFVLSKRAFKVRKI